VVFAFLFFGVTLVETTCGDINHTYIIDTFLEGIGVVETPTTLSAVEYLVIGSYVKRHQYDLFKVPA
jgi:hypothetical protein